MGGGGRECVQDKSGASAGGVMRTTAGIRKYIYDKVARYYWTIQ